MRVVDYVVARRASILRIAGMILLAFIFLNLAIAGYFRNHTYPNAQISGRPVGNMSSKDLHTYIDTKLLPQKLTLVYGKASATYTPKELGLLPSEEDISDELLRNHWLPMYNLWAAHDSPVFLVSSGEALSEKLTALAKDHPQQTKPGTNLQLNSGLAAMAVVNALRSGQNKVILPTTTVKVAPSKPVVVPQPQVVQPAKKTYTYCTTVKNVDPAYLPELDAKLASVYGDNRGWNLDGAVQFVKASANCDFTVWLSAADQMPSFGAICDSTWSCTVSPNVILNFDRWQGASAAWTGGGGNLDDYRTMVINHETGHWLSFNHKYCAGPGQAAPVMQQQSIDLQGCTANPWPLASERDQLRQHLKL